jgi:hypothetical protein
MESPTEKAIAMAQRMEQLEECNKGLIKQIQEDREKHKHQIDLYEAYQNGIKHTLEALLNRSVNL